MDKTKIANVAIDSGSSYMKAIGAGRKLRFPAVSLEVFGEDTEYYDAVTCDNRRLLIGETALSVAEGPDAEDPADREGFHGSDDQHHQICYALEHLNIPNGEQGKLIVSLPYGASQDKTLISRIVNRTTFQWLDNENKQRDVRFQAVTVMPQGVGALRRLEAWTGEDAPNNTLIVDIGSTTLDVVMLVRDRGNQLRYHHASDSSRSFNVTRFKQEWADRVARREGAHGRRALSYHKLMGLSERGEFTLPSSQGPINIQPEYERTRLWFSRQAKDEVIKIIGKTCFSDATRIVLTGGGTTLVDEKTWNDVRVVRLDAWANAEGQYLKAQGLSTEKGAFQVLNKLQLVGDQ